MDLLSIPIHLAVATPKSSTSPPDGAWLGAVATRLPPRRKNPKSLRRQVRTLDAIRPDAANTCPASAGNSADLARGPIARLARRHPWKSAPASARVRSDQTNARRPARLRTAAHCL